MEKGITENNKYQTEGISVKDLILTIQFWTQYLISRWVVIFSFGLLGGILGITYYHFSKTIYTASTTFVLEDGDKAGGNLGQYAGIASMVGVDLGSGGGIFQGDNIMELYKSRTMIEKTLLTEINYNGKSDLLVNFYIDFNHLRTIWAEKPLLKGVEFSKKNSADIPVFTRLQDSLLGSIVEEIKKNYLIVSKPDKKLSIIKADINSTNELFAKSFNEQLVKNVNDFYIQTKTKKSLFNVSILQQKVDSVRNVMNGAIYTAASVIDATPNLNASRQIQRNAPVQRSQFSSETNKIILGELVKNLELSKIALRKETPLIQVIDHPIFPLTRSNPRLIFNAIVGSIFFIFICSLYLILKKMLKDILN